MLVFQLRCCAVVQMIRGDQHVCVGYVLVSEQTAAVLVGGCVWRGEQPCSRHNDF